MSGYEAIPSASVEVDIVENGPTTSDSAPPSSTPSYTRSRWVSKVGYISLGLVLGCIGSRARWGSVANDGAAALTPARPSDALRISSVHGKSFLDSLPFEEIVPRSWNPAQPHPHEGKLPVTAGALSSLKDEAQMLSASLLGGSNAAAAGSSSPSAPHLLYHAHQSAFGLLYDSTKPSNFYSLDYFLLNSGGFDAQINQAYCAVATVTAVLNSLKYAKRFRDGGDLSGWSFDLPVDPRYEPYAYATQDDILAGECVRNSVIEPGDGAETNGIFKPPYGLGLEQSAKLLECHTSEEWEVTVHECDPAKLTASKVRFDLKAALIDPDARVFINFDRKVLGQVGGGHFSPLGAYHASTDSFLIVDTAKYKYPPVWVGTSDLFASMATVDRCGTYDYPMGQARLADHPPDPTSNKVINPVTPEEYQRSLELLNCEPRKRGYVILRKKGL
ncbi:hypothetical protein ACHAWF_012600 [Thalassiosira exigua]